MQTVKDLLVAWGLLLTYLLICGWLDREPETPKACVSEVRDGFGHIHQLSGRVVAVSVD